MILSIETDRPEQLVEIPETPRTAASDLGLHSLLLSPAALRQIKKSYNELVQSLEQIH